MPKNINKLLKFEERLNDLGILGYDEIVVETEYEKAMNENVRNKRKRKEKS